MALQAAILARRRAALSRARKAVTKHARGEAKEKLKEGMQKLASTAQNTSWFEILLVVFLFALPNDLLDIAEILIISKPVTIAVDVLTGFVLFLWFWIRVGESSGKALVKTAVALLIEVMPALGLLPVMTFLVLNAKLGIIGKALGIVRKLVPFI